MNSDILVIGGGIAGVSVAAGLAGHARVTLLEREPHLAHHASGRSAAMYEPRYGPAPVNALTLASGDHFRGLADLLTPRALMLLGQAGDAVAFARDCTAFGMQRISPDEACGLVPVLNRAVVAHAALAQGAFDIDTDALIQRYARAARAGGADLRTGAGVSAIARVAGRWRVTAGAMTFSADVIVNAAGAWADVVAGLAGVAPLGLRPLRRSMARMRAPGGLDVSDWPMMLGCGETWYAKPDAGALIVSPADEDEVAPHDAWADDMVLAEGLARYEAFVTQPVTRLLSSWAGLRTFAPDGVPVIGFDPAAPGFFWLAGQGGYGFQTAPAAAALAADLVLARSQATDAATRAALDPARFA